MGSSDQRRVVHRAMETLLKSSVSFQSLLDTVLQEAIRLTGAERGFVLLVDGRAPVVEDEVHLDCVLSRQPACSAEDPGFHRAIVQDVVRWRSGKVSLEGGEGSDGCRSQRSVVAVPLSLRGRAIGALCLDSPATRGAFTDRELTVLESFAEVAAAGLENARLLEECQRRLTVLEGLEADDPDSGLFQWMPAVV